MQPEAHKLYLDIEAAATDALAFTAGMDWPAFAIDAKTQAAVERKLEVIGEACNRLREGFPEQFALLEQGPQIIGLRNRVIHGYDNVDQTIIWDIVSTRIPLLLENVETILSRDF